MLSEIFWLGFYTAGGMYLLLMLAPVSKASLLQYVWALDVLFSFGVILAYAGSFAGIATAFVAGCLFSALTRVTRWFVL